MMNIFCPILLSPPFVNILLILNLKMLQIQNHFDVYVINFPFRIASLFSYIYIKKYIRNRKHF